MSDKFQKRKRKHKNKKSDEENFDSGYEAGESSENSIRKTNKNFKKKKTNDKVPETEEFFPYTDNMIRQNNLEIVVEKSEKGVQAGTTKNTLTTTELSAMEPEYAPSLNSSYKEEINLEQRDYSYHATTDAGNNHSIHHWIPILVMAGLVMAASMFVIAKYFYSVVLENSKEKQEAKKMKASYSEAQIIIEKHYTEPSSSFNTIESYFNGRRAKSNHSSKASVNMYDARQAGSTISITSVKTVKNESIDVRKSLDSLFLTTDIYEAPQKRTCLTEDEFCSNDTIEILTPFYTDTASCRPLVEGMQLQVIMVDDNGDLKVRHSSWSSNSWIFKNNYSKIQKV